MLRKRPLLLLIAVGVLVIYYVVNWIHQERVVKDQFAQNILWRERNMGQLLSVAPLFADVDMWNPLVDRLSDAQKTGYIDFFMIVKNGNVEVHGIPDDYKIEHFKGVKHHEVDQLFAMPNYSYMSVALRDQIILTIGIIKEPEFYVKREMSRFRNLLIEEIIYVVAVVLMVALWNLRDILSITRQLRKGGIKNIREVKAHSVESEMFIQGFAGYQQAVAELRLSNEAFGKQVLPSLKKEILSGKKPPYDFASTMVRTDINNFSHIFNTHDVDQFMSTINEFFTEVSHVVSRYSGLIHEFVGDEIIYYFKDEDHQNSFMIALSAIRDINEVAAKFNQRTLKKHGYPFTVKSSLAHGLIRFGPLVNGYSIAGASLIETVRILSHVTEKDGNVIYFDGAHLARVEGLCYFAEAARVRLKGYNGERTLYRYTGHRPLDEMLAGLESSDLSGLLFYRSDEDLIAMMRFLRETRDGLPLATVLKSIQVLREINVTKASPRLAAVLFGWINEMADRVRGRMQGRMQGNPSLQEVKLLSAAIMLTMNLIPRDLFGRAIEKRLSGLLRIEDRRVVANALEALTHFKAGGDAEFVHQLLEHENNRIAANALVHEGVRELSTQIVRRLSRMLSSGKPHHIASALYAIGELAAHHRSSDIVYYSTRVDFLKVVSRAPDFVAHENEMVRKQALIAARKSADESIIERAWNLASRDESGRALKDALQHLGRVAPSSSELKAA